MNPIRILQGASGIAISLLAEIPVPNFLKASVYKGLGEKFFGMNLSEAEQQYANYSSFQDLFTRKLKPDARKIEGDIISPVDGTLREFGEIKNGGIPQIKALTSELLSEEVAEFNEGSFAIFYLSPKDYHRVHSPKSFRLTSVRHIPGMLWPVNNLGLRVCPKLYSTNERVVFSFEDNSNKYSLIMIGALNVGGIVSTVEGTPIKLKSGEVRLISREIQKGEELGYFQFGSAVLFLSSLRCNFNKKSGSIKFGESLCKIP